MAGDTDIATIGIVVDTSQVAASTAVLDRWLAKGAEVDAMLARLEKSSAAAFKGAGNAASGVDALSAIERQIGVAEAAMARYAAAAAKAMAGISPAMLGAAGPSPAGGSAAHPFGAQWQQTTTAAAASYGTLTAALMQVALA